MLARSANGWQEEGLQPQNAKKHRLLSQFSLPLLIVWGRKEACCTLGGFWFKVSHFVLTLRQAFSTQPDCNLET